MKTYKQFLAESSKTYAHRIKIAGELPENFESRLKDFMTKYETVEFKKVASTPVQEHPHEFPRIVNKEVTMYDIETSYPIGFKVLEDVLKEEFGIAQDHLKVKHPADPTEIPLLPDGQGEYVSRLQDNEFKEAPDAEGTLFGDEYNMSMFKELMKDRSSPVIGAFGNEDVDKERNGEIVSHPIDNQKSPIPGDASKDKDFPIMHTNSNYSAGSKPAGSKPTN
tara:strand:+ start:245 stop:910 length:666 start_codon:yes stop_codon:yes gene_type:complete